MKDMATDLNRDIDRHVWVYDTWPNDEREKERNWYFNYDSGADADTLNELTKQCHIQKCPDMEYNCYVEVNNKRYYFFSAGEGAIIQVCMLCIMLDNKRLETFLRSMETSQGSLAIYAKRAVEKLIFPKTGPFYYFKGEIIAPETYRRPVNPDTYERAQLNIEAEAGEHRDLWDNYMLRLYSELTDEYNADDHKSMPRGRVDCKTAGGKLAFWVTLDKCIKDKEDEIKRIFNLSKFDVEFHYGTINYKCKDCK